MGGNPYADHVNSIAKYVVASESVDTSAWNPTRVIEGAHLAATVTGLKKQDGGDILVWGNGRLTDGLASAVELVDSVVFPDGVVVLTYRPLGG